MINARENRNRTQALALLLAVLLGGACLPGGQNAWAGTEYQWTWMKGANTVSQAGVYGTRGTAAAANTPGARYFASSWTDASGTPWLFGGYGWDGAGNEGYLNDLWKYDRTTGNWTWMKGVSTVNPSGTYGTKGTAAAANTPGARQGAVTWTDASGTLWLFGGYGTDSDGYPGYMNDLWKYTPATGNWTWIKGASVVDEAGTYGIRGTAAAANMPGARYFAVSWIDASGALWLFGGDGRDSVKAAGRLNDLWQYTPATGEWTWMKGSNLINEFGTRGTLGTEAAANTPGGRLFAVSWIDASGALWFFGGNGRDSLGSTGFYNDLWKYDPATGNWTWMKGASTTYPPATFGTKGTAAEDNTPGGCHSAVSWTDASGALWFFSGYGMAVGEGDLNDLWKYDPSTGYWTWVKGSGDVNQYGTYGAKGTPAATNIPGGRYGAVSWIDASGALWLFGGSGRDAVGDYSQLNDLWRLDVADTTAPTGTVVINNNQTATKSTNVALALNWDDGTGSGVTRMRFSNDGSTWTAWEALKHTRAYALPAGDGYKTVRVQYLDVAGNKSAVCNDYIRLDTVPPTGGILINNGAATTTALKVTLKLNWADVGSGVTRMRFSDNGSTWTAWTSQRATFAHTLPAGLGYHTVRVQYTDAASNYSPIYNDYIKVVAP